MIRQIDNDLHQGFVFHTQLTPAMSREQTAWPFASRATNGSALHRFVRFQFLSHTVTTNESSAMASQVLI